MTQNNIALPRLKHDSIAVGDWSFDEHMTGRYAVPVGKNQTTGTSSRRTKKSPKKKEDPKNQHNEQDDDDEEDREVWPVLIIVIRVMIASWSIFFLCIGWWCWLD